LFGIILVADAQVGGQHDFVRHGVAVVGVGGGSARVAALGKRSVAIIVKSRVPGFDKAAVAVIGEAPFGSVAGGPIAPFLAAPLAFGIVFVLLGDASVGPRPGQRG